MHYLNYPIILCAVIPGDDHYSIVHMSKTPMTELLRELFAKSTKIYKASDSDVCKNWDSIKVNLYNQIIYNIET